MRNPYLWGAVAGILILPVIRMAAMARRSAPPPILGATDWSFTSVKNGSNVSNDSLRGLIVLAHLQSNRCGVACQKNSAGFAVMKRFHGEAQQTVFLTLWVGDVAPQLPTSDVAKVAQELGLTWHLLQGQPEQWRNFISGIVEERSPDAQVPERRVSQPRIGRTFGGHGGTRSDIFYSTKRGL